ncbi:MAG: FAD-binding oxidoreductase [Candidatus Atabeyarchaeum deiterrae]
MTSIYNAIEDIVGSKYVSEEDFVRQTYGKSIDAALPERWPDVVVRPGSTDEVSQILHIANRFKAPVIPRGGACDLSGGSKPVEAGGIVIDLTRMDKIINIDEQTLTVTAQSGITWAQLNGVLFEKGYYTGNLGPGSGLSATIGGGLSHHSVGGGGGAKYGTCTQHVVALQVVLPQGDIVQTGSNSSIYVKEPFCRYGLGPDLCAMFLGDQGLLGVKTEATLEIFPKPPYHAAKTFTLKEPSDVKAAKIWLAWRKKGDLGIYDSQYWTPLSVQGLTGGLVPAVNFPIAKAWKGLNKAVFFYTMEGETPEELDSKQKIVDKIVAENGGEALGDTMEKGNWAKWHYEENGHWQNFHALWGSIGPGSMPCSTEHHLPIHRFPEVNKKLGEWEIKNMDKLTKAGPAVQGLAMALLCGHTTVEMDCGLVCWPDEDKRELNYELWIDQIKMLAKEGMVPYMMGEAVSRAVVAAGAYPGPYYDFLRSIKKTLDPNRILSPGKFYL